MTTRCLGIATSTSLLFIAICSSGCPSDDGSATTNATETSGDPTETSGDPSETETGDPPESNLVEIPGATFAMGCGAGDTECDNDNPEHEVTVSGFYIESTEVSVQAYTECVGAGMCSEALTEVDCNFGVTGRDLHPINCVTWQQAVDYCTYMGRRLPTEAEWELAAAGSGSFIYPWGDAEADCTRAHMSQMSGDMGGYGCLTNVTAEVEAYPNGASFTGVLQLAGNVDEWVNDWYAADYYSSGENSDPQGPASGNNKVNRGGDMFDASPLNLRAFERRNANPGTAVPERGFRCASDTP